ncbi:hypothetical protein ACWEOH_05730 [Agromyces sp. NPDC004153]
MTDYRDEASIGARIRAARRERGFRTPRDLANALTGTRITASVLENIESGRKADLALGQFLSIAYALRVPPSYLLAPLKRPLEPLDLDNVSDELRALNALEFDAWLSGATAGAHRPSSAAERTDRNDLDTLRELAAIWRELDRLAVLQSLEATDSETSEPSADRTIRLVERLTERERELRGLLDQEGFGVTRSS